MLPKNEPIEVIGGGLAGVEAAYALLKAGFAVNLYEMRPNVSTGAHKGGGLAELVCSNSLKSENLDTAQGALKAELEILDSLVLKAAKASRVPAGGALAVDRELFSRSVEKSLSEFPRLAIIREERETLPKCGIVATGPLTSPKMAKAIEGEVGNKALAFYDAVAPIITMESVDMDKAFFAARYGKGEDSDYLNCPMTEEEYLAFYEALVSAERVILRSFEKGEIFEGCMPVEVMASRGVDALRFGPMRPVGLTENKFRPYAVVQLRREDSYGKLCNLVGFQTNLTFPEQRRVFGMIPALKNAEFVRYGVMHRNTYLQSPICLEPTFRYRNSKNLYFAGQMTGVEGYLESAVSGLVAGRNLVAELTEKEDFFPPDTTMTGSLMRYVSSYAGNFQPMHVSFSLLPELQNKEKKKADRKVQYASRAVSDMKAYCENYSKR